ncbi:Vacuolar iron transporter 1 [Diplonema papillatum]|nr:Vacuolar iron transporter 1 [Diplonema papillatum]KAJ9438665.1 Vacuolar iron transporter 1 [Diplonema papillatum]
MVEKRGGGEASEDRRDKDFTPRYIPLAAMGSVGSSHVDQLDTPAGQAHHAVRVASFSSDDADADAAQPSPSPSQRKKKQQTARVKIAKSLVFGGVDGLGTTLTLVWSTAALGNAVSMETVLMIGIANLVSKGCSMGMGDYFGTQAENKVTGQQDDDLSWKNGFAMFASFVAFGGLPLLALMPFSTGLSGDDGMATRRLAVCVMSVLSLFLLGLVKAKLTSTPSLHSGVVMMAAGAAAAFLSFLVSHLGHHFLGVG